MDNINIKYKLPFKFDVKWVLQQVSVLQVYLTPYSLVGVT
jgi:hypothetical protein